MPDTFALTIISIVLFTVVAAFIRGRIRDKCLKSFEKNMVTLEKTSGKIIWGKLRVENTGLELIYSEKNKKSNGHEENSYIMYKSEYPEIQALVRYHDQLSDRTRKERDKELKKVYHPTLLRRFLRKIQNIFKTVKDSLMDVVNLLIGQTKKTSIGRSLSSQDKYVTKLKNDLVGSVETSYEPLLERYIGHRVVLNLTKGDKTRGYQGVLKDYSSEFVEIMDVDYVVEEVASKKADLIVLRKYGTIRHLGE
ncbi:MAG: hypothetical protein KAI70_02095 [Candidatus Omnitrophica bacterium]|nr:hypothetical protein [Candidatus Omnitrophota bacterium]